MDHDGAQPPADVARAEPLPTTGENTSTPRLRGQHFGALLQGGPSGVLRLNGVGPSRSLVGSIVSREHGARRHGCIATHSHAAEPLAIGRQPTDKTQCYTTRRAGPE